jgi:transposase
VKQATTIGLDIAKHVFQVHGADRAEHVLFRKRITRAVICRLLRAQREAEKQTATISIDEF